MTMHFLPPWFRRPFLLLLLVVLPLSACQLFAPPFDPRIGEATTQAYESAMRIVSEAEYGRFETAASFDAAVERYAAIDAQLRAAAIRAEASDPGTTRLSQRAHALLPRQIEGCRTQLPRLARIHRRAGIAPDAG